MPGQSILFISGSSTEICYESQDTVLFNDTILHNVAYGQPGASMAAVRAAAVAAKLDAAVARMPAGLDWALAALASRVAAAWPRHRAFRCRPCLPRSAAHAPGQGARSVEPNAVAGGMRIHLKKPVGSPGQSMVLPRPTHNAMYALHALQGPCAQLPALQAGPPRSASAG